MSQERQSATIKVALLLFFAGLLLLLRMDVDGARGKETMSKITSDRLNRSETENGASRGMSPNRLIEEKSPYLLQHANNPVNWFPWGDEAFERARKEDKPIFLSIGYSTCHWCHVMEHESFEDSTVAALMNDAFISIKVDREERPDIDNVYMTVCQMLTGSGGWPLTIIMTPDKRPFFAGTYFPRENRFGRVGMLELIPRISEAWNDRREDILSSANQITWALQNASATTSSRESLGIESLNVAFESLASAFDDEYGGFGMDRKFPVPHNLLFLLRYWKRTGDSRALNMVEETLRHMRQGGIYDHVGYGFHRYATDREWLVPHFEKMLYDQALISLAYIEAYQATGKDEYAQTAREIFEYVLRDMTSPDGGFYSAEDADSEGEEGKFYVWTESELRELLGDTDAEIVIRAFNVSSNGNFREESTGLMTGSNILHATESIAAIASQMDIDESELEDKIERSREKLFEYREKRVHPYKDDKILTDWNGLMIAALARGAQVFGDEAYSHAATKAADFILGTLRTDEGRLLHRYREGDAAVDGYVDDYAFLTWGLLELYEATFDAGFLNTAMEIDQQMLDHFWDDDSGGLFFSADDSEELISRTKEIYDGAVPSGNSVAMLNMIRLGRMIADPDLEQKASELAQSFAGTVGKSPSNYTMLMSAVDFAVGPSHEIIVVGDRESNDTAEMFSALRREYLPNKVVLFKPDGDESSEIEHIAGYLSDHVLVDGKATVYVCVNYECRTPVTDMEDMLKLIQ